MPKAKPKSVQPAAILPPQLPPPADQPSVLSTNGAPAMAVLYPDLEVHVRCLGSEFGPLGPDYAVAAMGWETEKEFQARMVQEKPSSKPEHWLYGDDYHCKNAAGEKVRTDSNAGNRAFDTDWCAALIHTILYGQWAGPHAMPGETINGETVRISRYGRVVSGQHCMSACILADEWLAKARAQLGRDAADAKYPIWKDHDHVFIETIVVKGMSEDARVLMSVDYVKPRTATDVFYTSEVFRDSKQTVRKELCKMLAGAVDLLWTRTDTRGYKTHPEICGFLDRHKRLLACVLHLFAENSVESKRRISLLRLNPAHCAALCYLMGCSATSGEDSDAYRNLMPPREDTLDWSLWDKAQDFWACLAGARDFAPVQHALGRLVESATSSDTNQGLGGRVNEKFAILAKAWEVFKDHPASAGPPFQVVQRPDGTKSYPDLEPGGDLCLSYSDLDDKGNRLPNGEIKLIDVADFYGIDCPQLVVGPSGKAKTGAPEPPAPSKEDIERLSREALERRAKVKG